MHDASASEEAFRTAKFEAADRRQGEIRNESANESKSKFAAKRKAKRVKVAVDKSKLWLAKRSAFISMGVKVSLDEAANLG